jgi:hypothetical protein
VTEEGDGGVKPCLGCAFEERHFVTERCKNRHDLVEIDISCLRHLCGSFTRFSRQQNRVGLQTKD